MLYLSQAIGRPVLDGSGESIGKIADLIVAVGDRYPPVTGIVVATDRRRIFLPWSGLDRLDADSARLRTQTIDIGRFQQRPNEILLRQDLMDKQIVDIDGRKVVRVNDLRLDEIEGRLRLVAVDVGTSGLLRRLGIEGPFRVVARNLRLPVNERYIDWDDVDPVETSIASIKLRVPHGGLAELHPADLASIIDQLAPRDRAGVLASLDDEAAADAIEEMEPDTQVEVLEDLEPERAADILEEMSPDDAADLEPDAETIYYVYVTDDDGRLVGVLSLRDLIVAPPSQQIAAVMIKEPVAVGVLADQDEVAQVVARYNLLAVPVVDGEGRLAGIVTVDDAMDSILPTAWKKRLPRLFARS